MTTFEDWLRQLRAAGKLAPNGINIDRALPFAWTFALQGDWTGAVVKSSLGLSPDGTTVVDFVATNDGYDAATNTTEFTISLDGVAMTAIPADTDGDALVQLAWDVLFTPSGAGVMRLFGGVATVAGKVTNA